MTTSKIQNRILEYLKTNTEETVKLAPGCYIYKCGGNTYAIMGKAAITQAIKLVSQGKLSLVMTNDCGHIHVSPADISVPTKLEEIKKSCVDMLTVRFGVTSKEFVNLVIAGIGGDSRDLRKRNTWETAYKVLFNGDGINMAIASARALGLTLKAGAVPCQN